MISAPLFQDVIFSLSSTLIIPSAVWVVILARSFKSFSIFFLFDISLAKVSMISFLSSLKKEALNSTGTAVPSFFI